jgi:Ser/Thr protein kinase RdoA (MazF antagonist)
MDRLWMRAAERIAAARGWLLEPLGRLGQQHEDRCTWLASGASGLVVVKAVSNPFSAARAEWSAAALPVLARRGYPVPEIVWRGPLDERWFLTVQPWLPGRPLDRLRPAVLDRLIALTELQAGPVPASGGWDVSWWVSVILFEGWEGWWETARQAAPQVVGRLRAFLEPAWGHRLPAGDVVHHDFGLGNVLALDDAITVVVDWDDAGIGSRVIDLASLLFEWHHLLLSGQEAAPGGDAKITRRIAGIAEDNGLRCAIAYAAIDRLALTARRGDAAGTEIWRQVTSAVLDTVTHH